MITALTLTATRTSISITLVRVYPLSQPQLACSDSAL